MPVANDCSGQPRPAEDGRRHQYRSHPTQVTLPGPAAPQFRQGPMTEPATGRTPPTPATCTLRDTPALSPWVPARSPLAAPTHTCHFTGATSAVPMRALTT